MSSEHSGELEFAALHADDLLLDALGARRPAGASGDVVAGLLTAYALEIDTRTGPLTGLLTADAADYVPMPQPVPAMVAAPPIDEPLVDLPTHRRAKFLVAHRAAAVVTVGSLVLGLGGVSAAVTGSGDPLGGIRRAVSSVTDQVTPNSESDTERVSHTLADAEKALAAADLRSARELLEKARTDIEGAADPKGYSSLRDNLIELRDRWHKAFDESGAPAPSGDGKIDAVPGEGVFDGEPGLVGDKGKKGDQGELPVTEDPSGIKQTKDQVADRAEQKLEPLPDLPVEEMREPTWAPIIDDVFGGK